MADVEFGPVRERVEWAGRHIEQMRTLLDAYIGQRPIYVFLSKTPDGSTMVETASLTLDPPMHLSLVLGDVTHHLRAALDNLVGAVRVGGPTPTSAFPLAQTETRFRQLAGAKLGAVPGWAVAIIQAFQPFGEEGAYGAQLYAMDRLAQVDRHRALVLHAPIIEGGSIQFGSPATHLEPSPRVTIQYPDHRTTAVAYPVGALVRPQFELRVVVAEEIEDVAGQEIVPLAVSWLDAVRAVVEAMDDELDAQWRRGEWSRD